VETEQAQKKQDPRSGQERMGWDDLAFRSTVVLVGFLFILGIETALSFYAELIGRTMGAIGRKRWRD
jgi:hypothetical protein